MAITFDHNRLERVKENSDLWWSGELKRPLVQFTIPGKNPDRPEPQIPLYGFIPFYDWSISPGEIIDRWDYHLSSLDYLGDAFPFFFPNFGPGILAGFLGAEVNVTSDTVWFHPAQVMEISDIRLDPDPKNKWFERVKELCKEAGERWEGLVQIAHTDLGGTLDIISSFRPGEQLLYDLWDYPEETKKLTWEVHDHFWKYFYELDSITRSKNAGHSGWLPIFSNQSSCVLQCDFCAMISPDMFQEFVLPELSASCKKLANPVYHLDGPGELPHLDYILSIPELKAIQWVPTNGAADMHNWPELYRKIHEAGKLIQIAGTPRTLDAVVEQIGTGEGIVFTGWTDDKKEALDCLERYGAL
jgi:5-methyltetrahydrofolate--homocysteine methyltransferase